MNFRETTLFRVMESLEKAIRYVAPELVKAVATALVLSLVSVVMLVGLWQGSILAFGREPVEHKAADVIESIEALRVTFDKSWHWSSQVQAKIGRAWAVQNCRGDILVTDKGSFDSVDCIEAGTGNVIFESKYGTIENLGNDQRAYSFLYLVGEVRVTPFQLLSAWVWQLF